MKNLLFLSLFFIISCKPHSDLKKDGGIRLVLEIQDATTSKETKEKCMEVLSKRIDLFGLEGVIIRVGEKPAQIIAEFPGKNELPRLRKLVQQSGKLSFYETYDNADLYPKLEQLNSALARKQKADSTVTFVKEKKKATTGKSLNDQLAAQETEEKDADQLKKENPLFAIFSPAIQRDASGKFVLQSGPMIGYASENDTALVNSLMSDTTASTIFGPYIQFLWTSKPAIGAPGVFQLVAVRVDRNGEATLSGNVIEDAKKVFDSGGGAPQISITMTREAGLIWKRMTGQNIGKSIAIASENQIMSYPVVQGEIGGGMSSITGNFTSQEVDDLIGVLKSGDMPATIQIIKEETIPPLK